MKLYKQNLSVMLDFHSENLYQYLGRCIAFPNGLINVIVFAALVIGGSDAWAQRATDATQPNLSNPPPRLVAAPKSRNSFLNLPMRAMQVDAIDDQVVGYVALISDIEDDPRIFLAKNIFFEKSVHNHQKYIGLPIVLKEFPLGKKLSAKIDDVESDGQVLKIKLMSKKYTVLSPTNDGISPDKKIKANVDFIYPQGMSLADYGPRCNENYSLSVDVQGIKWSKAYLLEQGRRPFPTCEKKNDTNGNYFSSYIGIGSSVFLISHELILISMGDKLIPVSGLDGKPLVSMSKLKSIDSYKLQNLADQLPQFILDNEEKSMRESSKCQIGDLLCLERIGRNFSEPKLIDQKQIQIFKSE